MLFFVDLIFSKLYRRKVLCSILFVCKLRFLAPLSQNFYYTLIASLLFNWVSKPKQSCVRLCARVCECVMFSPASTGILEALHKFFITNKKPLLILYIL